eukprot:scaffold30448_cov63-Phaeocystis_antarctica.AAC.5
MDTRLLWAIDAPLAAEAVGLQPLPVLAGGDLLLGGRGLGPVWVRLGWSVGVRGTGEKGQLELGRGRGRRARAKASAGSGAVPGPRAGSGPVSGLSFTFVSAVVPLLVRDLASSVQRVARLESKEGGGVVVSPKRHHSAHPQQVAQVRGNGVQHGACRT